MALLAQNGPKRVILGQKGSFWVILGHSGPITLARKAYLGPLLAIVPKRAILAQNDPFGLLSGPGQKAP